MQSTSAAPSARLGPLAMVLVVLGLLAMPVSAEAQRAHSREAVAIASAGWHGRAIQNPRPRPRLVRAAWPQGWSAGPVAFGTGYDRPGGSDRVRDVQRRLRQLGYRPGPADGLFGPRTRAATRWFQYKHGLRVTGRVTRTTLAVLRARSDHRPLPTVTQRQATPAQPEPTTVPPLLVPDATPEVGEQLTVTWLLAGLLVLLALALGAIASLLIPALRRQRTTTAPALPPAPVRTPARARPAARSAAARVLGYATIEADGEHADTATAALALRSAHRGWKLVEVVHDRPTPARAIGERPGLTYALDTLRSGGAEGLVVARLSEFTGRVTDLATVLGWLDDADAFLAAVDHELDTSTRAGRGTAAAVIELGHWERKRIRMRTREDLASRRFTPVGGPTAADLTHQITTMHQQGLSLRAITEALNLAHMPTPEGRTAWHTSDVKAATEERNRT